MTFDWGLLPNFLYPKTVIKFGWQNCQKPNISLIYDISVAVICLTLTELTTEIEKFKNNWYFSTKIILRKICIVGLVYSLYKITLKLNFLQVFGRKKWKGTSEVFNAKWQRYNLVWHISSLLEKWSTGTAEEFRNKTVSVEINIETTEVASRPTRSDVCCHSVPSPDVRSCSQNFINLRKQSN